MSENTLSVRLKHAAKTEAEWKASNPVLLKGEIAYSIDKKQWKTGDGSSHWADIAYDKAMPTGHTHDDRYYTESEINTKLGGKVDLSADGVSKAINKLSTAAATPADEDYYISQYAGGGTTTTSYYRRPVKALLAYIQSKLHKVATSGSYNDLSNKPTTFPPSEHNHDDSYLKLTGGTLTGPLNIKGNAASNPLMIRGIVGSDGNGTVAELYLQYGANSALKLGNGGAHSISADGGTYSGKSASATKATQDSAGQQINTTYLKGLSISGKTITSTKGNGSTSTITLPTATNSADGLMTADIYKKVNTFLIGDIDMDGGRATSAPSDYANDFNGGGA